ncbi:hypothetical protein CHCC15290_3670 [Bacillus licheniformis]|uniref:hypothetical protein n=1 Tax=Bacillus TaxID=1386 RepID=UPI0007414D56|nr:MULTISPECIES: hypothetical protein [Bacillus]ARC60535.1 hypothetical protein BaDB11_01895 [Bacillus licheniformis]KUL11647.1 hypothetical protein LI17339_06845 [Bacillus licheniformis LMG 17339]MCD2367661.1 hypothetical protein [Bacillus sp. BS3(2021)]MCJ8229054.1 hypothetical protein [Bacillus paralicheniformis]TWJ39314.1 hypothetical protein CHCC5026_1106 [Bacillus licheniformis]
MAEFSAEEQIQAVKRLLRGLKDKTIAREIGVSHSIFHVSIRKHLHYGEVALQKSYTTYSAEDKLMIHSDQ